MISALFVETDGCYFNLKNIDPWDIKRDARKYNLNNKIIAHPPCQLWGKFAKINFKRWGGEHNRPGNDGGCFNSALFNLRRCGGILEHPAFSYAWDEFSLNKPIDIGWNKLKNDEWVCEIWQSAYGHKCTKRTWLYYVGDKMPLDLNWKREKGVFQIGFYDQRGKDRNKNTVSGKEASATPIKLRNDLIRLLNEHKISSN